MRMRLKMKKKLMMKNNIVKKSKFNDFDFFVKWLSTFLHKRSFRFMILTFHRESNDFTLTVRLIPTHLWECQLFFIKP